jgi:hypothetical protein
MRKGVTMVPKGGVRVVQPSRPLPATTPPEPIAIPEPSR